MSVAEASNDSPPTVINNGTATNIGLSEILFLQRTLLLGPLPLSLERGISNPGDSLYASKESSIRRKGHQFPTKFKIGRGPPLKPPNTEFETINRKIYPGLSAVYHTLLKPGYTTLNGHPVVPPTPDIFQGLRYSPRKDIAVGDIDYSTKRVVELGADSPHSGISGTVLQDRIADNKTASVPAQVIPTTLASPTDSQVSETNTSDNGVSLYPEPSTPRSPPTTQAFNIMGNSDDSLNSTNASFRPLKPPEDLHTKPRSPSEPLVSSLDGCFGEATPKENATSPRLEIEQHGPSNKRTSPPLQNCQELRNELLDVRKYALKSKKEMQRLETRVRLLEKKVGIGRKPQKAEKNGRPLLVRGGDSKITRVIQHIGHLIELRRFMEKLKKTRPEKTKGGIPPATLNH